MQICVREMYLFQTQQPKEHNQQRKTKPTTSHAALAKSTPSQWVMVPSRKSHGSPVEGALVVHEQMRCQVGVNQRLQA